MPYTVNKLAKLAGVSVRTLHYYDEIGLLNPSYYGENNYRYYEEKELLLLQQILFYRELGFALDDIKNILQSESFDKIKALQSHKNVLKGDLDKLKKLIKTIDKTITYLRGESTMKIEDIFYGFTEEKQRLYEDFLIDSGVNKKEINDVREKIKHWEKDKWLANKKEADEIYASLADAIDNHQTANSAEVQALIKRHYVMTKAFWTPTRETYIGLGELYASHPDFVAYYENIHPKLLDFLQKAMKIFAEKELK